MGNCCSAPKIGLAPCLFVGTIKQSGNMLGDLTVFFYGFERKPEQTIECRPSRTPLYVLKNPQRFYDFAKVVSERLDLLHFCFFSVAGAIEGRRDTAFHLDSWMSRLVSEINQHSLNFLR